jgi:hypothetical protein
VRNTWDLEVRLGWIVGLSIVVLLLALTVALIVTALLNPVSIWTFLLSAGALVTIGVIVHVLYQLWGLVNAGYEMDRNALVIHWGGVHHQIPMQAIQGVTSGANVSDLRMQPGLRWPGYHVGLGETPELGPILFYATQPLDQHVLVSTAGMTYAISPTDVEAFLQALRERLDMGPTQEVEEHSSHPAFLDWTIWEDRWGLSLLLGSLTLLLLLVGVLCWRYPHLPAQVTLRFTREGQALLVADVARIFYFALMGVIFYVINGGLGLLLYHRERTATYLLWSGLLAVQGGLWAAVVAILLQQ